jgi:hypothetical protein
MGEIEGKPVTSRTGAIYVYDPETETKRKVDFPTEAKVMANVDGVLYLGRYSGADFYQYDGQELERLGAADGQSRPMGMIYHEATDQIVMSTQPKYGAKTGGAVATLDRSTNEISTYQNIVPDQTIDALGSVDGELYVGTNTRRGQGTKPATDEARVARFDLEAGEVAWETVPAPGKRRVVWLGGQGNKLFGMANSGWDQSVAFLIDTDAQRTVDTVTLDYSVWGMERAPDGTFYGMVGTTPAPNSTYENKMGGLVKVNPTTNRITRFETDEKMFVFHSDMEVIGDTLYFMDPASAHLRSVADITSF